MICAEYGECALVKLLLAHGGDITAIDKKRKSCLHLCASYGHETCLAILLDSGADGLIEGQDLLGNTALHYTAKYGHLAATRLLLETAADPLVRNKNNRTAYDVASEQGHEEVCSLLFEYMNPSSPQNCTGSAQKSAMNTSPILTPHKTQSARAAAFKYDMRVVVNSQGVRDNDKIDQVGYNLSSEGPTDYTQQGSEYDTFGDAGQIYEQQSYQDGPHAEGGHGSSDYLYEDEDYFQGDYESADYAYYGEKNDQGDAEGEIAPLEEFELNFSTWCVYESEEGYPYYLETSSQHSQWEDPRVHGILIVSDEYDGGDTAGTAEGGLTDGYD
ncbi:GABPB1, partial [Symbiodinium microadriaticum]